jgi:chloramphenicol 3-O phosphotransferase
VAEPAPPGQIVVLNGAPRSGKSSVAAAIQQTWDGAWMNLGVDVARAMTPPRLQPGVGLRPGEESHAAASLVPLLYAALYESIAAHSRLGLNVAVDVGHYDGSILRDCAGRLGGLPALFVGVLCPLAVIMERRVATGLVPDEPAGPGQAAPEPVLRWQREVHRHGPYDLELDTSRLSPLECASAIRRRLAEGPDPTAFRRLAGGA